MELTYLDGQRSVINTTQPRIWLMEWLSDLLSECKIECVLHGAYIQGNIVKISGKSSRKLTKEQHRAINLSVQKSMINQPAIRSGFGLMIHCPRYPLIRQPKWRKEFLAEIEFTAIDDKVSMTYFDLLDSDLIALISDAIKEIESNIQFLYFLSGYLNRHSQWANKKL